MNVTTVTTTVLRGSTTPLFEFVVLLQTVLNSIPDDHRASAKLEIDPGWDSNDPVMVDVEWQRPMTPEEAEREHQRAESRSHAVREMRSHIEASAARIRAYIKKGED